MSQPAPFFIAGDRALCVDASNTVPLDVGSLYFVHAVTSTNPQFLFLSADEYACGAGYNANRFKLVRPRTGQTQMPLNPDNE